MKTVLHVGCGYQELPTWLSEYREVRLDIDPECKPDIVASMLNLGEIGPYNAILANHCLEHIYPHEVVCVLSEFRRVLAPGGFATIFVPDLEDVRPTNDILYVSPAGPIAGLDMYYGHRAQLKAHPYMAHHTGFTANSLLAALEQAEFSRSHTERLSNYNLMGVGVK